MIYLSLKRQNHYIQPKLEYSRSIIVMYMINQLYGLNYGTWENVNLIKGKQLPQIKKLERNLT